MQFEWRSGAPAGSVDSLLADGSIRLVFSHYGDGCLRSYNIDIRNKRTWMNSNVLRQVRGFIEDYGEEDAVRIVDNCFGPKHKGRYRGNPVGSRIFSNHCRWIADDMLADAPNSSYSFDNFKRL